MSRQIELKHGRYSIRPVIWNGKPKAIALLGDKKVHEVEGANLEDATAKMKTELDSMLRARLEKRREPHIGTKDDYVEAFQTIRLNPQQKLMLKTHLNAAGHTLTATQLASAAGYPSYRSANSVYGRLAKKIGDATGLQPKKSRTRDELVYTYILAGGDTNEEQAEDGAHWRWTLHSEVVAALRELNFV